MHDDDRPIGEVLTRRAAVRLLGASGAASLFPFGGSLASAPDTGSEQAGVATPGCVVKPEMTEGPYFVDKQLNRSDVREGRPGQPLTVAVTVIETGGGQCRPLSGAMVDLWQCDAKGVYSGVRDSRLGFDTAGEKFLRGYQTTDASGVARFVTIYPGWYPGRTVHIHFKVRTPAPSGAFEFTSQWYFDEALNQKILAGAEYARSGQRDTLNSNDGIYRNGGDQLLLAPTSSATGLAASFALGLDLSDAAVGRPDGGGGRGPGGRRGRGPGR
jgi:protocatechuate 3,4-dioxygenase beta subunit